MTTSLTGHQDSMRAVGEEHGLHVPRVSVSRVGTVRVSVTARMLQEAQ